MRATSFNEYVSLVEQARFHARKRTWLYKEMGKRIKMRASAKKKYRASLQAQAIEKLLGLTVKKRQPSMAPGAYRLGAIARLQKEAQ